MGQIQPFGNLTDEEYEALKASIAEHGLLSPITKDQNGVILDGNHRLRACRELGIQPRYELVVCETDDDRYVRALVMNLLRRHLTDEQRREKVQELRARGWTYQRIAAETGIPVATAQRFATEGDPISQMGNEETESSGQSPIVNSRGQIRPASYNRKPKPQPAIVQAKNDRDADRAQQALASITEPVESGTITANEAIRAAARQRTPAAVPEPVKPPEGKFSCIVIDPPWPMQKIEREERPNQGVQLDYPVMSLEQIADETLVPVRTLAADDCHMYLWVTHKFLPAGIDLLDAWGFRYQCVMTWRKNVGITPFSWMYDTEHVLFGRRGNLKLQRLGLRLSFEATVQGHSAKPDVFYERVTEASPGPRVEMFSRRPREGFTVWGNEVADVV